MKAWMAAVAVVGAALLAGCGGGGETTDLTYQTGAQQQVVDHWCEVQPGMSRDEVIGILGDPTLEFDANSGSTPQSQFGEGFTVFYDSTGAASQLYVNPLSIDDTTKAQLDCPLTR